VVGGASSDFFFFLPPEARSTSGFAIEFEGGVSIGCNRGFDAFLALDGDDHAVNAADTALRGGGPGGGRVLSHDCASHAQSSN
jgi:hypothetical protein